MTQKEMADTLGISQNYLSLIESDKKTPSSEKLSRFANSLKISKDAFIFLSSEPPAELARESRMEGSSACPLRHPRKRSGRHNAP